MPPFFEKYRPRKIEEILGQEKAIASAIKAIKSWNRKSKALLFYGPTGTGKTSSAHAIASSLGYEIYEVNASDARNKESLLAGIGNAISQTSLFSSSKIILIDEIDGISGTKDRGCLQEVSRQIEGSTFPIILTVIDPHDRKFSHLKKWVMMMEFSPISIADMVNKLSHISKKEGIEIKEEKLAEIARKSSGDLRSAINDLEMVSALKSDDLDFLGFREREESIEKSLLKVFKTTDIEVAMSAFDNVKQDTEDIFMWIDENLPKEYGLPEDLARAYESMSRADVFNGRISNTQYWRLLVYINAHLSAGIALSKDKKYDKSIEYRQTGRILKIWWANQKSMKKKSIAGKLAASTHSSALVSSGFVPYLRLIFKNDRKMASDITESLKLDKEEVDWLRK